MCFIFVPSFKKISLRLLELLRGWVLYTEIFKDHNSVKRVDGVMILDLFTYSDSVSYVYQVLSKYLIWFQSYEPDQWDRR